MGGILSLGWVFQKRADDLEEKYRAKIGTICGRKSVEVGNILNIVADEHIATQKQIHAEMETSTTLPETLFELTPPLKQLHIAFTDYLEWNTVLDRVRDRLRNVGGYFYALGAIAIALICYGLFSSTQVDLFSILKWIAVVIGPPALVLGGYGYWNMRKQGEWDREHSQADRFNPASWHVDT